MDHARAKRLFVAIAGALAAAVALFAALMAINAEWGFIGCSGTGALGWTLPPLAGLLIGGSAWMLLFKAPHYSDGSSPRHSVPCPSCDKAVMDDWRLCPYCGRVLTYDQVAESHL